MAIIMPHPLQTDLTIFNHPRFAGLVQQLKRPVFVQLERLLLKANLVYWDSSPGAQSNLETSKLTRTKQSLNWENTKCIYNLKKGSNVKKNVFFVFSCFFSCFPNQVAVETMEYVTRGSKAFTLIKVYLGGKLAIRQTFLAIQKRFFSKRFFFQLRFSSCES